MKQIYEWNGPEFHYFLNILGEKSSEITYNEKYGHISSPNIMCFLW